MTGVERIQQAFKRKDKRKKCLIAFLAAGDPSMDESEKNFLTALETADLIEIGVPFSDPMADGPVIQNAYHRAIMGGVRMGQVLSLVKHLRQHTDKPLLLMVYMNLLLQNGMASFLEESALAGVDGLIIPDLPPEESDELQGLASKNGIALCFLVAPTSTQERIHAAKEATTGFLYVVSLRGVTGERRELAADLPRFIERVRGMTDLPLAVGFGISRPEHVRSLSPIADGVIVGSALVKTLAESDSVEKGRNDLRELLISLANELG